MHWPGSVQRTHSYSVTLSERVSLAHTPGAQKRAGSRAARKSCAGFYSRLIALGSAFVLGSRRACGILSSRLSTRELGPPPRPGLSTVSATIAAPAASEAPRPGACGGLETPRSFPLSDAWPAWSSCATPVYRNGSRFAPLGGRPKLHLQTPSRGLEEVAARIRGFTKPGPLRPGPRCGSVPCALHSAAPRSPGVRLYYSPLPGLPRPNGCWTRTTRRPWRPSVRAFLSARAPQTTSVPRARPAVRSLRPPRRGPAAAVRAHQGPAASPTTCCCP